MGKKSKLEIGWREWIRLPDFGIQSIKAKVDTGARTSALHAEDLKIYSRHGTRYVKFTVLSQQGKAKPIHRVRAPLIEKRNVKSSVGTLTHRPVIETHLEIGGVVYSIEVTLVNRDVMGFRMLLGRQALRQRFLVDPGRSFLLGKADSISNK